MYRKAGFQIRIDLMRIRIRIWIQHFFLIADSGSAIWMRIRIQQLKLMRIHAVSDPDTDLDPKPCRKVP